MKKSTALTTVATLALLGGFAHQVQGQAYVYSAYTQSVSSWGSGTQAYATGATPTGGSGGTTQDNDSWGGNANGTAGFGALGQAFTVTQSGVLSTAQLVLAGAAASFNVELYDLGPTPAGWQAASGSAPTIAQFNNLGAPVAAQSGTSLNGGPNLLLAASGFTYNGASGQTLQILNFVGGSDPTVNLVTGQLYMLSLDPTANADTTWWARGGLPVSAYNTGEGANADGVAGMQDFEGKSSVRDFDLAITEQVPVPEPSTIALGVMGAASFLLRRRSK